LKKLFLGKFQFDGPKKRQFPQTEKTPKKNAVVKKGKDGRAA